MHSNSNSLRSALTLAQDHNGQAAASLDADVCGDKEKGGPSDDSLSRSITASTAPPPSEMSTASFGSSISSFGLGDHSGGATPPGIQLKEEKNEPLVAKVTPTLCARPDANAECRLCFENDPEGLIAPCLCSGTTKWVHRKCLNQWRYHAFPTNEKAMTQCPTCHFDYKLYCTFDVHDMRRRKRKRCLRLLRDSVLVFAGFQTFIFLFALAIKACDRGGKISQHWPKLQQYFLFQHHFFLYWSVAIILVFLLTGIIGLCIACMAGCRGRDQQARAREVRVAYGRRENCCDDCAQSCVCYDPWLVGPSDCWCTDCCTGGCTCDGEAGLVLVILAVVALVLLGVFVALLFLSMALQRTGQRYLKVLHLKDVAERFAVEDLATDEVRSQPRGFWASTQETPLSQDKIQEMLVSELKLVRGVVHNQFRDAVGAA